MHCLPHDVPPISCQLYPAYFKLHVRWLPSLTPVTDLCQLLRIMSLIRGSPYGPAQALFKMVYNPFVARLPPSCNSNYFGYLPFILSDG
ncbi:hypothetical protein DVQ84_10005 [Yersinia enterocolitica]|nr:hypothetical protein [Yersinia enterocolitica]EKN6070004.1 hypothetical protein [Yersinia enterocolitica]EKN6186130.1 hypothetical protein [Yersinia enterocolitica]EKN6190801.1 hypothetical protein [Yersinia enterocolitica]EKN6205390.1 hypothetical protein [Yersinia enterocolitica]